MKSIVHLLVVVVVAGCSIPVAPLPLAMPIAPQGSEGHVAPEHHSDSQAMQDSEGHAAPEHHSGSNAINLFVGGSGEVGDADGITLGLDYEYRLSPGWGVGGFAEGVNGLDRSFAAGLQAYWHIYKELILIGGVGVERHHDETSPIGRVGAAYEIPLGGGWMVSPAVFYDFSEHTNLTIYGVNLGFIW